MTMWLPRCRTWTNPCRSRIAQASRPERTRSLPTGYLDLRDVDLVSESNQNLGGRGALEEQFKRLAEVISGNPDGVSLARNIQLWTVGHEAVTFLLDDRG